MHHPCHLRCSIHHYHEPLVCLIHVLAMGISLSLQFSCFSTHLPMTSPSVLDWACSLNRTVSDQIVTTCTHYMLWGICMLSFTFFFDCGMCSPDFRPTSGQHRWAYISYVRVAVRDWSIPSARICGIAPRTGEYWCNEGITVSNQYGKSSESESRICTGCMGVLYSKP